MPPGVVKSRDEAEFPQSCPGLLNWSVLPASP